MYIPVCFLFVKKTQVLEAPCGLKAMRTTNRGGCSGPSCKFGDTQGPYPPNWKKVFKRKEHLPILHFWYKRSILQEAETVQCTWVVLKRLLCLRSCHLHMGWMYASPHGVFHGCWWLNSAPIVTGLCCHPRNSHQSMHYEPKSPQVYT